MHKSASLDLRNISDELKFLTLDLLPDGGNNPYSKTNANPAQLVKTARDQFRQIMLGCKSQFPSRIDDAFTMLHVPLVHLKVCTEEHPKKKGESASEYFIHDREEIWLTLLALFTDQMTRTWLLIIPPWETAWNGTARALKLKSKTVPADEAKCYDLIYKCTFHATAP